MVGRDSSVDTATRYGLDGPGIESWLGRAFRTRPDRPWGPLVSYTMDTGSFPGVKWPGRGVNHHPHPGPSWPVNLNFAN